MNKLKQRILEYRFLVFLCRYVHRYNKQIQFSSDPTCQTVLASSSSSPSQTTSIVTSTQTTTTTTLTSQTANNDTTSTTNATSETCNASATSLVTLSSNTTEPTLIIVLNEKCHTMCKELVMNFLQLLDGWPACSEFYNQIIEGNLIEHLVWLQIDDTTELKSITSRFKAISVKSTANSASKSESFNFADSSFNLVYKLCRDYHACRAEFGRISGLAK